jgi:hypothetical protein
MANSQAFELEPNLPAPLSAKTISPVRLAINHHAETLGRHRFRFRFDRPIVDILARGLAFPRVHVSGTTVNGFRIWCEERGGAAPVRSKYTGGWDFTLPVRRVRGRESTVSATNVAYKWERDETGPVLVLERIPDLFLPEAVIDSLPNRAVDPQTVHERVERKLKRAFRVLSAEPEPEPAPPPEPPTEETSPWKLTLPYLTAPTPVPQTPEEPAAAPLPIPLDVDPLPPDVSDLKEAMAMVNELVDRLGQNIVLYIDEAGRLQAKRRVVSFIDL